MKLPKGTDIKTTVSRVLNEDQTLSVTEETRKNPSGCRRVRLHT